MGGSYFFRFPILQEEMRFGSSFGGVFGRFLEAFWAIFGGLGRLGRGLKKNTKLKPKLNAKKRENCAGPAGSAAWRWALGEKI